MSPPTPRAPVPAESARAPEARSSVRWLGHATTLIEVDGTRLLTDPVLTATFTPLVVRRAGPRPLEGGADLARLDAVLISHAHQDHLHLRSLRLLPEGVRVLVPPGAGRWLERRGARGVEELAPGARAQVGALEVRATPAAHHGHRRPFGPTADAIGFTIEGSARVYFAGDTDLFEGMVDIPYALGGALDVALVPVGGWGLTLPRGHLDPWRAAEALRLLAPRLAVPIHWGTFWPRGLAWARPGLFIRPAAHLVQAAAKVAPGVEVRVLRPGDAVSLALGRPR